MKNSWMNKRVWITGASSGIGRALAVEYAQAGASLILSARNRDRLEETAAICRDAALQRTGAAGKRPVEGGNGKSGPVILPFDMSDREEIRKAAEKVRKEIGPIDLLVLNAGITQRSTALETESEVSEQIIRVNLLGPIHMAREVVPDMAADREGESAAGANKHVVAVSSIAGLFGTPLRSSYSASKAGLQAYFDALRAEIRSRGVDVTIVIPAFIKTEISKHALKGDGSLYRKMDDIQDQGMAADECARGIRRAVQKKKQRLLIGYTLRARFGVFLSRLFPALLNRMLGKARVT